jgi:hypothetical protein
MDITGVWKGTTTLAPCGAMNHSESICNAVNRIVLFLVQENSEVRGTYRCDFGTYICRDNNIANSGYIARGTITGNHAVMRIMIPADVSSCMYYGIFSEERAGGHYTCFEGGGIVEQGVWEAERFY